MINTFSGALLQCCFGGTDEALVILGQLTIFLFPVLPISGNLLAQILSGPVEELKVQTDQLES
jgi:hypothetical protein